MKLQVLQAFQYLLAIGLVLAACRVALRFLLKRSVRSISPFGSNLVAVSPAADGLAGRALCQFGGGSTMQDCDPGDGHRRASDGLGARLSQGISRFTLGARSELRAASLEAALASREQELALALHDLEAARSEMKRRNTHDPLTGTLSHRAFRDALQQRVTQAQQTGTQVSLMLLDLDAFRFLNDAHGHQTGDYVLQYVAHILTSCCGPSDLVGRFAGDAFAIVLPGHGPETALQFAEKIRSKIDAAGAPTGTGERVPLHSTIAVTVFPDEAGSAHSLLVCAESALRQGKRDGGNVVVMGGALSVEQVSCSIIPDEAFRTLDGLVRSVDAKDSYTKDHSNDVTRYALLLGRALGLPEQAIETLRVAATLHDVGKIGIPDQILKKPGRLTASEYAAMQRHVELSEQIIREVAGQDEIARAIGGHHERWDGHGYPRELSGDDNPLLARILAIADAFSAMTLDRPYRKALSFDEAFRRLRAGAGSQFDPDLVEPFISALPLSAIGSSTAAHAPASQAA
jgi:diguanylate cyclase (GGDEF)-like protein